MPQLAAAVLALAALAALARADSYSFVVLSDIHIGEGMPAYDGSERYSNTYAKAAIAKINSIAAAENIRFAFITGDLTDSAEDLEFRVCRDVLDLLEVPYYPVLGNHDVWTYNDYNTTDTPTGDVLFEAVWGDKFRAPFPPGLQVVFKAPPTFNPEFNITCLFQNFVVQVDDGLTLIGLDWNTRRSPRRPEYVDRGVGPWADVHDFPGGTIDWLDQTLAALADRNVTQIVFLHHHPYKLQVYAPTRIYGFDRFEQQRIREVLQQRFPLSMYHGVIAGHLHRFFAGTAFNTPGWDTFLQWETDTCKGHVTDTPPRDVYGAFTLVRVMDGRIVGMQQFIGPYE